MEKQIALTLDCAVPVNPTNFFQIWRCDKLTFAFTFLNNGEAMTLPEGTVSRVFAKRVGADGMVYPDEAPIFSGEFSTPTTATFTSEETSGAVGHYLLSVILYNSDSELITQQGVYFDILENGYAGIVQPAQDFRDEVLDARDQAESYAEDASASALVSEGYAVGSQNGTPVSSGTYFENNSKYFSEQASSSAGAAAASESASESYAETSEAYAVGTKNGVADPDFAENNSKYFSEQSGNSAAAALASATNASNSETAAAASAATAATLVVNATELGQTKLNAGALHIENGAASNSTYTIPPVFSVAAIVSPDYVGDIIKLGALTISASSGVINAFNGIDEQGLSVSASTTQSNVVVFTQTTWGVLTVNSDSDAADMSAITGTGYTVGSSTSASGAVSNLKIFNFDITAAGAPYTLDDYTAGKPVPPSIKGGFYQDIRANYAGYIQRAPTPSVSFTDSTNLELTISDDSQSAAYDQYIAWKLPRKLLAGETIKVSGEIILKTQSGTNYYNLPAALLTSVTSFGTGRQNIPSTTVSNKETISTQYTLTGAAEYIGFYRGMSQGTGDKQYEIVSFDVEIDGETLALENYTVLNGGTQTIFDVAGCAQDATVSTGSIAGDNDISVARLVDFISAI